MSSPPAPPVPGSYWAEPALVLAGPWPGAGERGEQRDRVRALLDAGIRAVLDLRTPAEPPPVRQLLERLAGAEDVTWMGIPIANGAAPSDGTMSTILDVIDAHLARERPLYVHCQGGLGRTGTVVACWWIRHGRYDAEGAVAELRRRRREVAGGTARAPETDAQLARVRGWRPGR
ncbi:MAG: dual specificity protein phosphatase family protein [Sandaracinaceae bacterium]